MFLSKKETPDQFHGMWAAGVLNLGVSYFNLIMYNLNGGITFTMVSCILSLIVSIVIFTVIKRMAQKMLWEKLQQPSRTGMGDVLDESSTFY